TDIRGFLDPLDPAKRGIAISIGGPGQVGTARILDNVIENDGKTGIVVDNLGSTAEIRKNTVRGDGGRSDTVQNGIQVSNGATGRVLHNQVSLNNFSDLFTA